MYRKKHCCKMKFGLRRLRRLLLASSFVLCCLPALFSQEKDSIPNRKTGLFTGISLGAGQSEVLTEGVSSVSKMSSAKRNSWSGTLEIGYYFTDYFGISSGINFSSYSGQAALASYSNKFTTTDSEKESYERRITGNTISENQNVGLLGIPISLHIRIPLGNKLGIFLQTGVNISTPIVKKYQSNGSFTYKGYYPSYNVVLENLPDYGFPTNATVTTNGALELKPLCLNGTASAGFDFKIQPKMHLVVAAYYDKSLSTLSSASKPESFQLSLDKDLINSLMDSGNQTMLQSMGVKICLRYFLHQ